MEEGTKAAAELRPGKVQAAIRRAEQFAQENQVPLTAERLAAELNISVLEFRRLADGAAPEDADGRRVQAYLQAADRKATAQVMEYALRKGGSASICSLYLKRHAGCLEDEDGRGEEGLPVFMGEQEI